MSVWNNKFIFIIKDVSFQSTAAEILQSQYGQRVVGTVEKDYNLTKMNLKWRLVMT